VRQLVVRLASSRWLRVAGTLAGLALLVHAVDLGRAAQVLLHIDPAWTLAAMALTAVTAVTGTLEWGLMLRAAAPHVGWRPLASWYLQGLFVGHVTPSGGGYTVQVLAAGRVAGRRRVVAALAAARMSGTLAMAAWGLVGAVALHSLVGGGVLAGSALYVGCMISVWPLAFASHRVTAVCRGRSSRLWRSLAGHIEPFTATFQLLRRRPATVLVTLLVSGAGWGLQILALVALGHAIGVQAPWTVYAVSVPIALLAGVAPISLGGIGLREGVLVGLLTHWGVDPGHAGAVAVLLDLQRVPLALAGAVLFGRAQRQAAAAAREGSALEMPAPA
jgi:glycosyltransferase 2 family protein